ncbi:MAG TPA: transposase [Coleofasciculaceae cyanobacterium]|jgi:transposase-like protein
MSPRKLTEDDKQDILEQYRNSEATTSTLAQSYEVSSSTISRFLKNKLSSTEYEDLIQQKRLARTPRGEKSLQQAESVNQTMPQAKVKQKKARPAIVEDDALLEVTASEKPKINTVSQSEAESKIPRRRRRRSLSEPAVKTVTSEAMEIESTQPVIESTQPVEEPTPAKLVLDHKVSSKSNIEDIPKSDKPSGMTPQRLILKSDRVELEEDEEDDPMNIMILKEMLGEDLEDINDDEDEDEDEDWEEDESALYSNRRSGLRDVQILPLSQALIPRTCYLVIDRSAELIVKPLADFADLGAIPETEVSQRTLPVFDNHSIAKRFSHRRERVIKVPDGRMLQKTSHHLQDKGITRLLIDGQIYSLST